MELEHSFTIPVPPEQAWEVLLDVEQVAPCMPGATIDAVDGDVISGRIKVKVGPIALTYAGQARFTEKDEQARVVVLEASGKETRGTGTASATVRSTLQDLGGQTRVTVHTTMNITGRPAQFGRGVMVEVGSKIIERFATNLAAQLATGGPAAQLASDAPAAQLATDDKPAAVPAGAAQPVGSSQPAAGATAGAAAPTGAAATGATAGGAAATGATTQGLNGALPPPPAARPPGEDAIDLLSVAGLPVLKRALPGIGILAAALVLLVLRSRRKRRRAADS
jgi:carbon monoxide dehydrogenase subunit G